MDEHMRHFFTLSTLLCTQFLIKLLVMLVSKYCLITNKILSFSELMFTPHKQKYELSLTAVQYFLKFKMKAFQT